MSAMASQITGLSIARSTVGSGADQIKHQNCASLAFVQGIHRLPVNSPHKRPETRKMFPFDDGIMMSLTTYICIKAMLFYKATEMKHFSYQLTISDIYRNNVMKFRICH